MRYWSLLLATVLACSSDDDGLGGPGAPPAGQGGAGQAGAGTGGGGAAHGGKAGHDGGEAGSWDNLPRALLGQAETCLANLEREVRADIRIAEKQGGYGARQMRLSERDQRPNLLRLRLGRLEPGAGHGRADRAANGRGDGVGVADLHL